MISKLIHFSIFCVFFYEFYDLTNDYLKYNHLIRLDVRPTDGVLPAITVCLNAVNRRNEQGNDYFKCSFLESTKLSSKRDCLSFKTYIRFKNNSICYTFFSSSSDNTLNTTYMAINIINYRAAKLSWHQIDTPSH